MIPKALEGLLDEKDEEQGLVCWTLGYVGQEEIVKQHKMNPIICEKGYRNRPLTKEQKSDNRKKSRHVALSSMYSGLRNKPCVDLMVRTVRAYSC